MQKIIMASGPVIVENGKVLLNKHGDTTFYKFCGGKVEDFEHGLIDHARREVKEEMGVEIKILNNTPFFMHTIKQTPDGDMDVILVHFLARRIGEIKPGEDMREWKWIPIAELDQLDKKSELAPNIIPTLKHFGFLK
jgi:ADP-ribose pyrophosphatase YjhB (NUDIX family)